MSISLLTLGLVTVVDQLVNTDNYCNLARFGRKWIMLVCLYSQCLIGISLHFVQRLLVFMVLRFVQGIMIQGLQCVSYSMIMELFCPSYRTLAGCVAEAFWAGGEEKIHKSFHV